jgi:hydroxymethylglutaryl-CoA reductase (NADPH)
MALIPSMLLKQLYTNGSLQNVEGGVGFSLKNRLSDGTLIGINSIKVGDKTFTPEEITIFDGTNTFAGEDISKDNSVDFPLRKVVNVTMKSEAFANGKYPLVIEVHAKPFGKLKIKVDGAITQVSETRTIIPRNDMDDFSEEAIKSRQDFVEEFTGKKLNHITNYSFDPHITAGNCEHFTGVAQVPIGIAGPIKINGEYAKGEFLVPMATAEGTLVASYNRGMKVLNLSGGITTTIIGDSMQRAPVFVFKDARGARDFSKWADDNFKTIAEHAESTSSVAKLQYIDTYLANCFSFMRFNFSTGDAAGQNMVGKATFAACSWILDNYPGENKITNFYLESNLATDKKASQVNIMKTRGKRVVAEATVKASVLREKMRVEPAQLAKHSQISNIGSILSGANNNGAHSANGLTALFIATGQDVANISESSAGVLYTELTPEGDLYMSITIPSMIIATYGGGVGLATQRESLEMMDCYGKDKVKKLAEIIAGVVLAGEISLASAISSSDWVSSHEQYGRNR